MALTIAQAVMNEVQAILLDPNGKYWTSTYLVNAYNIVVTAIIGENPNALTKVVDFTLAAGVDQRCPSDATQFLRMPANVNGPNIRQVTAESLSEDDDDWYSKPPSPIVRHVIPDALDPLLFRVDPPNDGTGQTKLHYAFAPPDATALSDTFGLTEAYRIDVRNGVLGMAYALNTDRQDLPKSQFYLGQLDKNVATKIRAQDALAARVGTPQTTE